MRKKFFAVILVLAAVFALLCPAASADYENTYTNTGDMRKDLIGVALTQVGYTEGPNNDTKYGDWMNLSNHPWCGIFVSWCARQAGIPTTVLKNTGIANPANFGLTYYAYDEYTPRPGDLFFKKGFTHVGIVYTVGSTTFTTIEGNTGNAASGDGWAVMIQTRKLSEYYYASPNYPTDDYHNYKKYHEDVHPHKEYYACADCPSNYYTGNKVFVDSCKQCVQESCSHSFGEWSRASDSKHSRVCSKCEMVESENHNWKQLQVTKEATCKEAGAEEQECTVCKATQTKKIPQTNDHDYGEWKFATELNHQRVCAFCGKQDNEKHKLPENTESDVDEESVWQMDDKEHWLICEVCEAPVGEETHDFGTDCVAPCSVCNFVREEGHFFTEEAEFDQENHWRICAECEEIGTAEPHEFEFDCSESCSGCGYTREVEHSFSEELQSDKKHHWYACTICGLIQDEEDHIPGPEATEEAAQVCTLCGWELEKQIRHEHFFGPIQFDEVSHFGTCRCGETMGPESHMWDMATGRCSVCSYAAPVREATQQSWEFVWYIGGGVLLLAIVLTVVLVCRRKREDEHL